MPKRKKENESLPSNVRWKNGAYRYRLRTPTSDGQIKQTEIFLGRTKQEMYRKLAELEDKPKNQIKMNDIFNLYMAEVAPEKGEKTYKNNIREVKNLMIYFGQMYPEDVEPHHVWKYLQLRKEAGAPVGGNREKALLSHVFTFARQKGFVRDNPCFRVGRNAERARSRYITHKEFIALKRFADKTDPIMGPFLILAYKSYQRRQDLIRITMQDLLPEGIYFEQGKSLKADKIVKKLIIGWSPKLRWAVNELKKMQKIYSDCLVCQVNGKPYTDEGMSTKWQRLIDAAMEKGVITERFTFHDIRAKAVSDEEDLNKASRAAGHTSTKTTQKHYDRKARVVNT